MSHPTIRTILILSALSLWALCAQSCRSLRPCGDALQASRDLPGLWNSIKRMRSRVLLQRWIDRFLSSLLDNGRYQLEERGGTYVVIDPKESHQSRCRMSASAPKAMLKDPQFLQTLYNTVNQYGIGIKKYHYRPPKTQVVESKGTKVWGGNCNLKRFRVEASYWKAISTIYTKPRWAEACQIGRQLERWRECFTPAFKVLYEQRMKRVCKR